MSDEQTNSESIKEILRDFAIVLGKHSEKTDTALEKLTSTVEDLTKSHIESKKDREFDSSRMERFEENQKEQGSSIKAISDTVLLLDERMGTQKGNMATWGRFAMAIITAVAIAKIIPI